MRKTKNISQSSTTYAVFVFITIFLIIGSIYFTLNNHTNWKAASTNQINRSTNKSYPTYPRDDLTPGDVIASATKDEICQYGYAKTVRVVSVELKRQVYTEYGLNYPQQSGEYEVDHFISLELGGSNDIKNLWPELASPKPGFHEKDLVENYLHERLCKGIETLSQIQREIKEDWVAIYNQMGK